MKRGALSAAVLVALALAGWAAAKPSATPRCPATDRNITASSAPATRHKLVPHRPTGLTLCRYRGLNPDPKQAGTLAATKQVTDSDTIAWLVEHFDALPPLPKGTFACPAYDGSEIVALFHYAKAQDDPVTIQLSGCGVAGNGHIERWTAKDQRLLARLTALSHRA